MDFKYTLYCHWPLFWLDCFVSEMNFSWKYFITSSNFQVGHGILECGSVADLLCLSEAQESQYYTDSMQLLMFGPMSIVGSSNSSKNLKLKQMQPQFQVKSKWNHFQTNFLCNSRSSRSSVGPSHIWEDCLKDIPTTSSPDSTVSHQWTRMPVDVGYPVCLSTAYNLFTFSQVHSASWTSFNWLKHIPFYTDDESWVTRTQ